jgi:hypothetical protein
MHKVHLHNMLQNDIAEWCRNQSKLMDAELTKLDNLFKQLKSDEVDRRTGDYPTEAEVNFARKHADLQHQQKKLEAGITQSEEAQVQAGVLLDEFLACSALVEPGLLKVDETGGLGPETNDMAYQRANDALGTLMVENLLESGKFEFANYIVMRKDPDPAGTVPANNAFDMLTLYWKAKQGQESERTIDAKISEALKIEEANRELKIALEIQEAENLWKQEKFEKEQKAQEELKMALEIHEAENSRKHEKFEKKRIAQEEFEKALDNVIPSETHHVQANRDAKENGDDAQKEEQDRSLNIFFGICLRVGLRLTHGVYNYI